MTDTAAFIEGLLSHKTEYDPSKAHEYYLRTRELKGRRTPSSDPESPKAGPRDSRSNRTFEGKPLPKLGTRMNEDTTPEVSPKGAKLLAYDGNGNGRALYKDGSVYDGNTGWAKAPSGAVRRTIRMNHLQDQVAAVQRRVQTAKDPKRKKELLDKIKEVQAKLHEYGNMNSVK